MARRGRPPKQAQTLFENGVGITAAPSATNAAEGQHDASDDEMQEQATEEPAEILAETHVQSQSVTNCNQLKKHLKISVYAIAKNESKFVKRWMDSMKEADEIVVLDTGSTDDTVKQLRDLGAKVETKVISPWRFDVARNESMKLVSPDADLLVCTDIDEIFLPGWREKLEKAWLCALEHGEHPTTGQYEYVWNFREDGSDGTKFWYEKIHTRESGALWTHPVHEILSYSKDVQKVYCRVPGMRLEHHADPTKSRGQYLALLEMSVKECPDDDRNMHYLGREYMFRQRWDDAITTLRKHLTLPRAQWRAERAASMRFIAKCYGAKKDILRQEIWLWRAVQEDANQREAALELAEFAYSLKDYNLLTRACEVCLSRNERVMSYLTKAEAWGYRPWDLYCIGLWYTGKHKEALEALDKAIALKPDDERLLKNREVMTEAMKQR